MSHLKYTPAENEISAIKQMTDDARADLAARINAINPFSIFEAVEGKEGKQIVCPNCGSGSGKNHTGITPTNNGGSWLYNCFACGSFHGDLISIIAAANNLDTRADFFKILAIGAAITGQNISLSAYKEFRPKIPTEAAEFPRLVESRKNISLLYKDGVNFWRGISRETFIQLNWGFLPDFYFAQAQKKLPAVIISNNSGGIFARAIQGKYYQNNTPTDITVVNLSKGTDKILITEGAINGASILQAVGSIYLNFGIIASGGTSGNKNVLSWMQRLYPQKKPRVLIAYDNDSNGAGQKAGAALLQMLIEANFTAAVIDITKTADIDLNDVLQQDNGADKLKELTLSAVAAAQFKEPLAQKPKKDIAANVKAPAFIKDARVAADYVKLCNSPPTFDRNRAISQIILAHLQWKLDRNNNPVYPLRSAVNFERILKYDAAISNLFAVEEFSEKTVLIRQPFWDKSPRVNSDLTDSDCAQLRHYIRKAYADLNSRDTLIDSIIVEAQKKAFHVVKNWFNDLPNWDGVARAENLFIDFLKVPDNEFSRAVTFKWLLAAVCRIFYPACNFQAALVLQGNQNIGKSYILERLGGEWYGCLIDSVDSEDAPRALRNFWICEIKELAAARRAEINAVKSFIERPVDTYREKYGRFSQTFKRHCIFAITCNDRQFLRDQTGNRRYWILESPLEEFHYTEGLTAEYIQQIWAEVYYKFKKLTADEFTDKILELPLTMKIEAEKIATTFTVDDGLKAEIAAFLDVPILPPAVWNLLTLPEKRKFFIDGSITINKEIFDLRKENLKTNIKPEVEFFCKSKYCKEITKTYQDRPPEYYWQFVGCYIRNETCASEVLNELPTGKDKRTHIFRICEVLSLLDDWERVKTSIKNFNGYGSQKNIFYRKTLAANNDYIDDTVDVPF